MKRYFLAMLFLALISAIGFELSSMENAGFNMTGAPGEGNCTGCHGGMANSDTAGSVRIRVVGNPPKYFPGATYDIEVTTRYPGGGKFGFALAARMGGKAFIPVGKLSGSSDMQVTDYITHTNKSNKASNSKTWNFTWQAPVDGTEPITLYAAGVAANNDGTNSGDLVYTDSFAFAAPFGTGVQENDLLSIAQLYPNPTRDVLHIAGNTREEGNLELELMALNGKIVYAEPIVVQKGSYRHMVKIPSELPAGVYYLRVRNEAQWSVKPFVLQW